MKIDHHLIENHIDLQRSLLAGGSRRWWPNFVYHTTSLENAVSVLIDEKIYSRNEVLQRARLKCDIADTAVINGTDDKWKAYSRFYLRPKTPTLYINEGVKPWNEIRNNAHCAVPISFLFNSKKILTRDDCIFSDGNLGSGSVRTGNDAQFFLDLPFDKIFHSSPHNDRAITFHRNAEVVIPNSIDLAALEYITCRSEAEKETLMELLGYATMMKWKDKIGVSSYAVFNEEWNFIRAVKWTGTTIVIKFNEQRSKARGPFRFSWEIVQVWDASQSATYNEDNYTLPNDLEIVLNSYSNKSIKIWIKLDTNLVYQNTFHASGDAPF